VTVKELVPVGSTARLTHWITIPADHAYVYIANGQVLPFKSYNTVDLRNPYCRIGFADPSPSQRKIEPDSFRITKITEWEDYRGQLGYPQWARLNKSDVSVGGGFNIGAADYNDAGPPMIMYATIFGLKSDRQPQIREMVCGHWNEQNIIEPLTLVELRKALGDLVTIDILGPGKT